MEGLRLPFLLIHFQGSRTTLGCSRSQGGSLPLVYTQYTNRGVMNVYVDNVLVGSINQYGSLSWQRTWTSSTFPLGVHTVKLVHASGTYVDIDAIMILP